MKRKLTRYLKRTLKVLGGCLLLGSLGCECMFQACYTTYPEPSLGTSGGGAMGATYPSPAVHLLEIVPPVVYAIEGESFVLEAREWVDGALTGSASVVPVWTEVPSEEPVFSSPPPEPRLSFSTVEDHGMWVEVWVPGTTGPTLPPLNLLDTVLVIARLGGLQSRPAKVLISATDTHDGYDMVAAEGTVSGRPSVFMLDARARARCLQDVMVATAGPAILQANLEEGCLDEGSPEVALFPGWGAASLWDRARLVADHIAKGGLPDSPPLWTESLGDEFVSPVEDRFVVPVVLRKEVVDPETSDARILEFMEAELKRAQEIFDRNRVGIRLEVVRWEDGGRSVRFTDPSMHCRDDEFVDSVFGGGLDFDELVIQVAYVESDGLSLSRGLSCHWTDTRKFALALVDWNQRVVSTLAHELAHILALNYQTLPYQGHTGEWEHEIAGFNSANLMWGASGYDSPGARELLSLGQVFRMNFDARSWLFQAGRSGPSKNCQCEPYQTAGCPRLGADISFNWGLGYGTLCEESGAEEGGE